MTKEEIILNNELIAGFMEAKIKSKSHFCYKVNDMVWAKEGLKYDSNWSWLMDVIEKIESLKYDTDILFYTSKNNEKEIRMQAFAILEQSSSIIYATGGTKIECVYTGVVDFIKWFNKNKKS